MAKHKQQELAHQSSLSPRDLVIADVPVKIRILHGDDILEEYADTIDIAMTLHTDEGRENMAKFYSLRAEKQLSTKSALFRIASDSVAEKAQELLAQFAPMVGQHTLHFHVKRNGEIKYRKLVEE